MQIVVLPPFTASLTQLAQKLGAVSTYQVTECPDYVTAVKTGIKLDQAIFVAHVQTMKELSSLLVFIKSIAGKLKSGNAKFVLTSALANDQIRSLLLNSGVSEILAAGTPLKSIQFKIEKLSKLFPKKGSSSSQGTLIKKNDKDAAMETARADDARAQAQAQAKSEENKKKQMLKAIAQKEAESKVVWQKANPIENEIFLFNESSLRRIGGRWVTKLAGPSPEDGRWVALANGGKGDEIWQWVPTPLGKELFFKSEGCWVFFGQEPRLQGEQWLFVGKKPELSYQIENREKVLERKYSRITLSINNILAAKDPENSKNLQNKLVQSWVRYHRQDEKRKKEKQKEESSDPESLKQKKSRNDEESAERVESNVSWTDPLKFLSDFWLCERNRPRKSARNWLLALVGPSPKVGKWEAIQYQNKTSWKWKDTSPKFQNLFVQEMGEWIYQGDQEPSFEDGAWMFFGKTPSLGFVNLETQTALGYKFQALTENKMNVSRDSEAAFARAEEMYASLGKPYDPKKSKELSLKQSGDEKVEDADFWYKEKLAKGIDGKLKEDRDEGQDLETSGEKKPELTQKEKLERKQKALEVEHDAKQNKALQEGAVRESEQKSELERKRAELKAAREAAQQAAQAKGAWEKKLAESNREKRAKGAQDEIAESSASAAKAQESKAAETKAALAEMKAAVAEMKVAEAKAAESKIAETKIAETKIAETKAADTKAADTKAADTKAADTKAADTKAADTKAADTKAADTKAADTKAADTKAADTKAAETKAAATKPEDTKAVDENQVKVPFALGTATTPSIAPLSLAFLASELICKATMNREDVAERYCTYVSAALGGQRVELWTSDGSVGLAHSPGPSDYELRIEDEEVITSKTDMGSIRARAGQGAKEFLDSAALIARGIFLSLQMESELAAKSESEQAA